MNIQPKRLISAAIKGKTSDKIIILQPGIPFTWTHSPSLPILQATLSLMVIQ